MSAFGLIVAALVGVIDQAVKLWLLDVFGLAGRAPVALGRFVDLVVTWNAGISYGLFQQEGHWANGRCWRSRPSPSFYCGYGLPGRRRG